MATPVVTERAVLVHPLSALTASSIRKNGKLSYPGEILPLIRRIQVSTGTLKSLRSDRKLARLHTQIAPRSG